MNKNPSKNRWFPNSWVYFLATFFIYTLFFYASGCPVTDENCTKTTMFSIEYILSMIILGFFSGIIMTIIYKLHKKGKIKDNNLKYWNTLAVISIIIIFIVIRNL